MFDWIKRLKNDTFQLFIVLSKIKVTVTKKECEMTENLSILNRVFEIQQYLIFLSNL